MTVAGYFIGFFVGSATLAIIASLDLSAGIGILLSAGCAYAGLLSVKVLKKIKEAIE